MAHPYKHISPLNCWKGYERVPGKAPGTKGSCRKSSPANMSHPIQNPFTKNRKHNIERVPDRSMTDIQKTYDDNIEYAKSRLSGNELKSYIEEENAMLKDWRSRKAKDAAASPMNATKGGGTTKVCLPKSKVNSMSAEEKKKVVRAKESAGRSGKRERSQRSEVKGARKKGATLKDWFEKENWINVKTGEECGAPTKRKSSNEPAKTTKGKGRNFRTVEEGAGMTKKGVEEYKKKNPGSNLQTAVTEKNPKGKRAARRKSFCARSKGWTGERGKAARRRWNC